MAAYYPLYHKRSKIYSAARAKGAKFPPIQNEKLIFRIWEYSRAFKRFREYEKIEPEKIKNHVDRLLFVMYTDTRATNRAPELL